MPKTYARHELDVYDAHLYVTSSRRGWASIRRTVPFATLDHLAAGETHEAQWKPNDGGPSTLVLGVYVNPHQSAAEHVNTCAHEAVHVAQAIMQRARVPLEGEPLAYLVGWLSAWIWKNTTAP